MGRKRIYTPEQMELRKKVLGQTYYIKKKAEWVRLKDIERKYRKLTRKHLKREE